MFDHKKIEAKWAKYWEDNQTFKTNLKDFSKPKYYVLGMFPYPSAEGLHVGHPESYTATDILARMKRMQGYNVLNPIGFDSFGLPAEQFAIKTGNHPNTFTKKNIENFTQQLKLCGFSYDWSLQVSTADPSYYKWTQWIFKQLFQDGLAKYVDMPVNWCEELGTVLANDEIVDGKSERGGFPVIRKNMKQWALDIPKYAEKLLQGLDELTDWPESTKEMQRNWIGKSIGAEINFKIKNSNESFTVFTTRPDTLFGATYCVIAPEHPLVNKITTKDKISDVEEYITKTLSKSEMERVEINKDKTGVFTGAFAINPVNNKEIPVYISDYVMMTYGTGAIMAVPAHDQRDYEFAKKFEIEIIQVIEGGNINEEAYDGDGIHINSDFINGLNKENAINKMIKWLEENNLGKEKVNYRLREWIFARQRYWGEPVPVVHLENGNMIALRDEDLPLLLPDLTDYSPLKTGEGPLSKKTDWVNVEVNGIKGKREVNTMPSTAGSSWYFLRYIDPHNNNEFANKELLNYWLPVDLYVGGSEHAVGHLLYSRFWNNYLFDKGFVPVKEPFKKLVHQGMILGDNGIKMSKSLGNVVNPNDVIEEYGADAFRLYEMFMGPLQETKPWNSENIKGARKFLERVYRAYNDKTISNTKTKELEKVYHQTVKKVTEDYETLDFNTAIAQMMIFINAVYKEDIFPLEYAEGFLKLLNPVSPFITEELWKTVLNKTNTISYEPWPEYDENILKEDTFELIIQINGRLKDKITTEKGTSKEQLQVIALNSDKVKPSIENKSIKNIITIPDRLVNIVISE